MIKISNLNKSFGEKNILKNINLEINNGEIFGIVGTSGVGKSTLLNCINGLENYQSGDILVDNIQIKDLGNKELREFRKNIGMIFQSPSLVNRKDVFHNISLPLEFWGYDRVSIKKRVHKISEMVGIEGKLDSKVNELSGGQKQRVSIARALIMEPKYLLSDESTSALDPKTTMSILNLLNEIRNEMNLTVVIVTHEMQVVQGVCERMSILENGKVANVGRVSDLFLERPQALKSLLGEDKCIATNSGVNLTFNLSPKEVNIPIIYELSKITKSTISLIDANFYNFNGDKNCTMTINFSCEDYRVIKNYLITNKIQFKVIDEEGI